MKQETIDQICANIQDLFAQNPARDLKKNLRAVLTNGFTKLDLVAREDFDIQTEVLRRNEQQLKELESRIADMENKLEKLDT